MLIGLPRSSFNYRSQKDPQITLQIRIKDLAYSRPRYGYRRIHILLCREGWNINPKRVYRLYKEEGLSLLHKRPKRHKTAKRRKTFFHITGPNSMWAMDFVSDALFDGRKFRTLPIIDVFTRECCECARKDSAAKRNSKTD